MSGCSPIIKQYARYCGSPPTDAKEHPLSMMMPRNCDESYLAFITKSDGIGSFRLSPLSVITFRIVVALVPSSFARLTNDVEVELDGVACKTSGHIDTRVLMLCDILTKCMALCGRSSKQTGDVWS